VSGLHNKKTDRELNSPLTGKTEFLKGTRGRLGKRTVLGRNAEMFIGQLDWGSGKYRGSFYLEEA